MDSDFNRITVLIVTPVNYTFYFYNVDSDCKILLNGYEFKWERYISAKERVKTCYQLKPTKKHSKP